jgi:methionine-rich copper-binding protein CopC
MKVAEKQEVSKEQLSKMIFDTMRAKAILANQNALAHNEVLKRTPAWKAKIKENGNKLVLSLIKAEREEFDVVQRAENTLEDFKGQNVIDQAFDRSNKIINLLARAVFLDYDDVETVITALSRNKSSMLGIAKKINTKQ